MEKRDFVKTVASVAARSSIQPRATGALAYKKSSISLTVNGEAYELEVGDKPDKVSPSHTLAHTLRDTLGLTGTKIGCDRGACSCCTIIMDGRPVLSCMTLTVECDGKSIITIEGLEDPKTGRLHPLQQAFINNTAFQCGFCTPGIIVTAKTLLDRNHSPTEEDVKEGSFSFQVGNPTLA